MRLVRVWLGEYHCCSVLSELLKRGLEPCVSGWGGGGADEEWSWGGGIKKEAVISKVLGQFHVESNILFSANFMNPDYQMKFEEMTCWFLSFRFCTNLKVTNKK